MRMKMSENKPKTRLAGRDAETGRFKPVEEARRERETSVVERLPFPGHGDTDRGKKDEKKK